MELINKEYLSLLDTMKKNVQISNDIKKLWEELKTLNLKLWEIEDEKRLSEKNKKFDQKFIELSRNVYKRNDERAQIKSKINQLTNSNIREIKKYTNY